MFSQIRVHKDIIVFGNALSSQDSEDFFWWLSIQKDFNRFEYRGPSETIRKIIEYQNHGLEIWRFSYEIRPLRRRRFLASIFRSNLYFFYHFYKRSDDDYMKKFSEVFRRYKAIERGEDEEDYVVLE